MPVKICVQCASLFRGGQGRRAGSTRQSASTRTQAGEDACVRAGMGGLVPCAAAVCCGRCSSGGDRQGSKESEHPAAAAWLAASCAPLQACIRHASSTAAVHLRSRTKLRWSWRGGRLSGGRGRRGRHAAVQAAQRAEVSRRPAWEGATRAAPHRASERAIRALIRHVCFGVGVHQLRCTA